MSLPDGLTVYTFSGIQHARMLEGDSFPPWFADETQYTKDAVLGGSQSYLDIGASVAPPLSFRALVETAADRQTLQNARNSTGTLSNTRGRSATVTLVKATPIDGPINNYWIDLTYEYRPS